ncbi:HAD family hydrolase [Lutispora sp.]|uniref:HAD family hydrolase n=1 Tax=Lutispora sp. TaxID=2828727 RepID=UPI000EB94634|nr:HAD family hydrolase [Lutispora sp.]MEA4960847.1 HAD family hydrolase [Lutispora sp.]HCJ58219.1 hypothetical protein [Clostridiaceae bacterium]
MGKSNEKEEYLNLYWWIHAQKIFIAIYKKLNIPESKAIFYAEKVRYEIIKPDEYILYDDTIEMLDFFKSEGYANIILSNHIPELHDIVEKLGLINCIEDCISSESVGIKGVLVRGKRENTIKYYSKDLRGLKEIIDRKHIIYVI